MRQTLGDVEDGQGRSVGCILKVGGMLIAVTPSGAQRVCQDRKSAVWWLRETAAGRDPDRPKPVWEFLKRVGITLWLLIYFGGLGLALYSCAK